MDFESIQHLGICVRDCIRKIDFISRPKVIFKGKFEILVSLRNPFFRRGVYSGSLIADIIPSFHPSKI